MGAECNGRLPRLSNGFRRPRTLQAGAAQQELNHEDTKDTKQSKALFGCSLWQGYGLDP